MIYIRHISLPGKLKMTLYFSFDFTINPNMFLILSKLSKSSSLHPTALVLCTYSCIYAPWQFCECMLPKQSCLWALAWPNQLFNTTGYDKFCVWDSPCCAQSPPPPPPLKPKLRRLKGGKSLLFTPLNVRFVCRFAQDVFSSLVFFRRAGMMNHPPIPITELAEHTELLKANDNLKLSQEYEVS